MPENSELEREKIGEGIEVFKYTKGNRRSYLIDKKILIDAGVPVKKDIKKLILTHCHFDHIVYALKMRERTGCEIISSEKCAEHLRNMDEVVLKEEYRHRLKDEYHKIESFEVDRVVEEGDLINGLKVIETPGHTDGGISLYRRKDKVLFTGDTWFGNTVGRTDLPSSSDQALADSLKKLKSYDTKWICPGHGKIVKSEEIAPD